MHSRATEKLSAIKKKRSLMYSFFLEQLKIKFHPSLVVILNAPIAVNYRHSLAAPSTGTSVCWELRIGNW